MPSKQTSVSSFFAAKPAAAAAAAQSSHKRSGAASMGPQSQSARSNLKKAKTLASNHPQNPYFRRRLEVAESAEAAREADHAEKQKKKELEALQRVDLGTKLCRRCQEGDNYHKAHDTTCPRARNYDAGHKAAKALLNSLPEEERRDFYEKCNSR